MDMYGSYKSPFGYESGVNGGVDSYGVDHSGFSTQDELQYQTARAEREKQLAENLQRQGVADSSFPQYGTDFWGDRANNYGFGNSNISQNIQNVTNKLNHNGFSGGMNSQLNFGGNNYATSTNITMEQVNNRAGNNNSIVQRITTLNPINAVYKIGQRIGELAADTKLAYDYWQRMNQTGDKLVKTFGSGQGADIDNYYHPLLQCELAKISPQSRDNGIALGYAKEYLMDYPKKRFFKRQSHAEIMQDSQNDLQNNLYGSNLGYHNPNVSCEDLLNDRRTPNMRKLEIW